MNRLYLVKSDISEECVILTSEKDAFNYSYEHPDLIIEIYELTDNKYIPIFAYYHGCKINLKN